MRRVLAAVVAAAALLGGAAAAHAATGTVTGLVPASTGPLAKKLPSGIVATPLFRGATAAGTTVGRNRRYTLKLAPGLWLLTSTSWGPKGAVERGELVQVKAGRRRAVALQERTTGVVVSVGRIMDPTNTWDIGQIIDVEMGDAADDAPCDYVIAVDRNGRGYQEVLKELRFNTTRYVEPGARAAARKALKALPGSRPNYRVEGNFTALDSTGRTTANIRVVDTRTGRVIWRDTLTSSLGADTVARLIAAGVSKAICGAPIAFAGNIRSTITVVGAPGTWTANLAAVFSLSDGGEKRGYYELEYDIASLSGTVTYHADGDDGCTIDATFTGSTFGVNNGSVRLRVYADGRRTYFLTGGIVTAPTTATGRCPDGGTTFPITLASGYLSADDAVWTGPILAGQYTGPWNPVAGFTPPAGANAFQIDSSWQLVSQAETP